MSIGIEMESKRNVLMVRLSGELDDHTADQVREKVNSVIEKENIKFLIFNLEKLTFMDSSGLGVILGRYRQMKQRNGEMIVCAVPPAVERLFNISGLFKVVGQEPTEKKALQRLGVN